MNRFNAARGALVAALLLLIAACASGPDFRTEGVDRNITPRTAVEAGTPGTRVIWGGIVIAAENLENRTRIEVLGYPLDSSERPRTEAEASGRFLIEEKGYVETADLGQGRLVTVLGTLGEPVAGRVGEADYEYPVVRADQVHLWPTGTSGESRTRFHFGIGVILH